jgi:hypothetical protein
MEAHQTSNLGVQSSSLCWGAKILIFLEFLNYFLPFLGFKSLKKKKKKFTLLKATGLSS